MIIGNGMIAKALSAESRLDQHVLFFAKGCCNSNCTDLSEFERDARELRIALSISQDFDLFVYFGTVDIFSIRSKESPYIRHKRQMEDSVMGYSNSLIIRFAQLAGMSDNMHTLLNFLFFHIVNGIKFNLFKNSTRNILDIHDAIRIMNSIISRACNTLETRMNNSFS